MYSMVHWSMYDYANLIDFKAVDKKYNPKTHTITTYSQYIIVVDTETSKQHKDIYELDKKGRRKYVSQQNYVVAFTISIRHSRTHENIVTLWGSRPDDCAECIKTLRNVIVGDKKLMFIFNLSYDWWFLRKFLIRKMGIPDKQLNVDSHSPINIEFGSLIIRDALILAQRKLEKWADDLEVEHRKAVGSWDYDITGRDQDGMFDMDEMEYIENDTLACCECIDKLLITIGCKLKDIPFTATGISRRVSYNIGRKHKAKYFYSRIVMTFYEYQCAVQSFHGGYTHHCRLYNGIYKNVTCYDFASSYPFVACSEKFPMSKFIRLYGYYSVNDILSLHDEYAFMFRITMVDVRLRDPDEQMPVLQVSKNISGTRIKEMRTDNGRVLSAPIYEAYMNDIDLELVHRQYTAAYTVISEVHRAKYDYLPRWFTDHVYQLYTDKCQLKGGDPVLYDITKMKLNSVAYGMLAMRNVKDLIIEDYDTGEYKEEGGNEEEIYNKFITNKKNIYPYQWSCWVTSYAQRNLHELGACCDRWLYSDTDNCFSDSWHLDKIEAYNQKAEKKLRDNGYEPVDVNGKKFYLGRAELDKECDEFKSLHSKCYVYKKNGEIFTTVAGVPKKTGRKLIKDLNQFDDGFIFEGEKTGKKTHVYHTVPEIYVKDGIIFGDSVDLIPCDYEISGVRIDNIADHYDDIDEIVDSLFVRQVTNGVRSYD